MGFTWHVGLLYTGFVWQFADWPCGKLHCNKSDLIPLSAAEYQDNNQIVLA